MSIDAQMSSIEFIENKGQWEKAIFFKAKIPGGNLYLEEAQITYQFYNENDINRLDDLHHHLIKNPTEQDYLLHLHAFSVEFLGAQTNTISSSQPTTDYLNYFIGKHPENWASNVKKYKKINYDGLYKNIDLKFYLKTNYLEYDFIVHPEGDPNEIKWNYKGVDYVSLEKGKLKIQTSVNELIEQKPYAYQIINGEHKEVKCKFKLEGTIASLELPRGYDKTLDLIIDPILIFASYSGSNADNWGFTSTFDNDGNLYGGGVAFSIGYPTTIGAYQFNFNGGVGQGTDITISKFSSDGSSLIYSTYLGGDRNEAPHSLIVNSNNELLIMGTTSSDDFPTSPTAFDPTFNLGTNYTASIPSYADGSDIIVTKLSTDGMTLLGSTYIGGSGNDGLNTDNALQYNYADDFRGEIIVDNNDNIYIASSTRSNDFPITPGAFQPAISGINTQDACVFKLSPNLDTLIWSSYLGGTNNDAAYSLQFNSLNELLITGGTRSTNFPITAGTIQPFNMGGVDGWIAKIDNIGSSILACTYLGTPDYDQAYFVQLDGSDNVYVVGQTEGTYPISPASVYNVPNSGQFIHKLLPDLSATVISTSFGTGSGEVDIALSAFLVNDCNNILISGWGGVVNVLNGRANFSTTNGLPTTPNAIQTTTDGSDYYLMMLSQDADTLLYATFYGGDMSNDHVDGGTSRFDKKGIVYQAVCASCTGVSSDFPTTPGVWSNTNESTNCNLGVFKIDLVQIISKIGTYTPPRICGIDSLFFIGDTISFQNLSSGAISYSWDFGDGASSTEYEPRHSYTDSGTYNVTLIVKDSTSCIREDTSFIQVRIHRFTGSISPDTVICANDTLELLAAGGLSYSWSSSIPIDNPTESNILSSVSTPTIFSVEIVDSLNCIDTLSVNVGIFSNPIISLQDTLTTPWGSNTRLPATTRGISYLWEPPNGLSCTTCLNPTVAVSEISTFSLTVTDTNGCKTTDMVTILVDGSIYLPNSFTPNGDGDNDVFYVSGKDVKNFELFIFNRWGQQFFYSNHLDRGWDGNYKGSPAKTETYVWKVLHNINNDKEVEEVYGTVTLIR